MPADQCSGGGGGGDGGDGGGGRCRGGGACRYLSYTVLYSSRSANARHHDLHHTMMRPAMAVVESCAGELRGSTTRINIPAHGYVSAVENERIER